MVWEAKRHEEAVAFNQKRIQSLQEDLAELCQEKGMADAKLMELDQLVGQLLNVNESLVGQLTGKPLKHDMRVKVKKTKKAPMPRAASLSTASVDAGKVTKFSRRNNSQLVPVLNEDVEALQSMHKMYSKIAKSIKKNVSPIRSGSAGKHASTAPGTSSTSKMKTSTRLARKKAQLIDQFNEEARSSLEYAQHLAATAPASYSTSAMNSGRPHSAPSGDPYRGSSFTPRSGSMEVRLPRASYEASADVSVDYGEESQHNAGLQSSFLNHSMGNASAAHVSFTQSQMSPAPSASKYNTTTPSGISARGPQPHSNADMQGVISALEEEFDQLNLEYRRLLSSVQTSDTATGHGTDLARHTAPMTQESIEKQAGELVSVIQKLHKKGEQLRTLKSSP
jgi:myosin heavy subunit